MKNKLLIVFFSALIALGTVCTFSASAAPAAEEVWVDEDFSEGYELDKAYTHAEIKAINSDIGYIASGWNTSANAMYTVKQIDKNDASKGNYISLGLAGASKHAFLASDIDTFSVGTLITEMKLRINGNGRSIADILIYFNESDAYKGTLGAGGNATTISNARSALNPVFYGNDKKGDLTTDSAGFYNIKLVWTRASESDKWHVSVYDANTDTLAYDETAFDASFKPSSVMFYSSYHQAADAETSPIDLANLKVTYIPLPEVVSSDCVGAQPQTETIVLNLNTGVDAAELGAKLIKKDDESVIINTDCTYSQDTYQLTLELKSYLEYGTTYIVRFTGAGIKDYEFATAAVPLKVESEALSYLDTQEQSISSLPASGKCTAVCNVAVSGTAQADSEIVVILIACDSEGRICYAASSSFASDDLSKPFTAKLAIEDASRVNEIRTLIWEKTDSGYQSIVR